MYKENDKSKYIFSDRHIKRGLYKTGKGKILNADINGALNILKKSNVVSLNGYMIFIILPIIFVDNLDIAI